MIFKWIQDALTPKSKGKLRKKLHVKKGEKIPMKKLKKAAKSKNPTLRKEALLAERLRKMRKRKPSKSKARKVIKTKKKTRKVSKTRKK